MNWYKKAQIRGEWWIIDGNAIFADNNIGEMGHEAYVLETVRKEIVNAMNYYAEEIYDWNITKQEIIQNLVQSGKIDPKLLIKKYGEDYIEKIPYNTDIFDVIAKKFNIPQEQLDIADESGDIREYGMKNLGWKRMAGNNIETQTLTSADLKNIMDGIYDAYSEESENSKFNIEIRGNGKVFWDIPWQVMENGVMAISEYGVRGLSNMPTYAYIMNWYKLAQSSTLEDIIENKIDLNEVIQSLKNKNIPYKIINDVISVPINNQIYIIDEDLFIEPAEEWIWTVRNIEDYINIEDFNTYFWEHPFTVYHATTPENIEEIKTNGLKLQNKTRGINNRSTGSAIFTSSEPDDIQSYGDIVIEINTSQMKKDKYTPEVSKEEPVSEAEQIESLANKIGLEDFQAEVEHGISPTTVIFYQNIPPKYLRIL